MHFVEHGPVMIEQMAEAEDVLRNIFKTEEFRWELTRDPETGYPELWLTVYSKETAEEGHKKLNQFDSGYWRSVINNRSFGVNVSFIQS